MNYGKFVLLLKTYLTNFSGGMRVSGLCNYSKCVLTFKSTILPILQVAGEFPDSDFGLLNYGKFFLFLEEQRPPTIQENILQKISHTLW